MCVLGRGNQEVEDVCHREDKRPCQLALSGLKIIIAIMHVLPITPMIILLLL